MPTGKVKWFDSAKGFGFLTSDDGQEVFLHAQALPSGVTELKAGTRLEFGLATGKRGAQALSARVIQTPAPLAKNARKSAADMAVIVEDLIKLLETAADGLQRGKHPEQAHKIAAVLRAVADDFEGR